MNQEKIERAIRNYVKAYGMKNICRDDVIRYIEAMGCDVYRVEADCIRVSYGESGDITLSGYIYSNENVKSNNAIPFVLGFCGAAAGAIGVCFNWLINLSCIPVSSHDTALMLIQIIGTFMNCTALVLLSMCLLVVGVCSLYERCFYREFSLWKKRGSDVA